MLVKLDSRLAASRWEKFFFFFNLFLFVLGGVGRRGGSGDLCPHLSLRLRGPREAARRAVQ